MQTREATDDQALAIGRVRRREHSATFCVNSNSDDTEIGPETAGLSGENLIFPAITKLKLIIGVCSVFNEDHNGEIFRSKGGRSRPENAIPARSDFPARLNRSETKPGFVRFFKRDAMVVVLGCREVGVARKNEFRRLVRISGEHRSWIRGLGFASHVERSRMGLVSESTVVGKGCLVISGGAGAKDGGVSGSDPASERQRGTKAMRLVVLRGRSVAPAFFRWPEKVVRRRWVFVCVMLDEEGEKRR